jgi:hypothetical protein
MRESEECMSELKAIRDAYKAATGKNPSPRDDAATLERKIAEHKAAESASSDAGGAGASDADKDAGGPEGGAGGASEADAGDAGDAGKTEPKPKAEPKAKAKAKAEEVPEAPDGTAYVRHPEHVGCSFRGVEIVPDEEGLCLVPLSAVTELASHGFELVK